jgi:hypothetical protein
MKTILQSPILKFILSIKSNSAIFNTSILISLFAIFHFFTFYYGHSNTQQPFNFLFLPFFFYIFICLLISFLVFYKKLSFWKVFLLFTFVEIILIFIPAGFATIGLAFLNDYFFIIGLLILSKLIDFISGYLYKNIILNSLLALIGISLMVVFIILNSKDLSVKRNIQYHNNSMFKTIEECSDYILPKRENDCRSKFTEMHNRWSKMERGEY